MKAWYMHVFYYRHTHFHSINSLLPNSDLKKVWKTVRTFRYDLNQIPFEYTVEVTNWFKGLDLIDRGLSSIALICNYIPKLPDFFKNMLLKERCYLDK